MESLDGFAQRSRKVSKLGLELSDSLTALIRKSRGISHFICHRSFDEQAHCPEIAVLIFIIKVAIREGLVSLSKTLGPSLHHCKGLTHRVSAGSLDLGLDMIADHDDIVHHTSYIREHIVILALEYVSPARIAVLTCDNQSIIDESRTERTHFLHLALHIKQRYDFKHLFHI